MSKKLLFKGGHRTGMIPYEIEDFLSLYMRDARVDEKTKAYIDSVIGNTVLNLCPYRNVLVTHKYDTVEGNVVTLDDCQDDEIIQLSEIQGNTMVNCNKDTDKELILMPNLETSGYSNITLTEGVDGGKVDVSLEGNTMVNVCEQEDPIAITKSYTVDTGNHIALQGEYDGKCRPNIYGNTLVNLNTDTIYATNENFIDYILTYEPKNNILYTIIIDISYVTTDVNKPPWCGFLISTRADWVLPPANIVNGLNTIKITVKGEDISKYFRVGWNENCVSNIVINKLLILEGDYTNKPIPDYFTGMKSSFEDKLIPEDLMTTYKTEQQIEYLYAVSNPDVIDLSKIKPNTKYTLIYKAKYKESGNTGSLAIEYNEDKTGATILTNSFTTDYKQYKNVFITPSNVSHFVLRSTGHYFLIKDCMLVEGDWSNQDYDPTKGGKYRVDYKVTGKNKFPPCPTTSVSGNGITFAYDSTTQTFSYEGTATNTSVFISIPCPNLKLLKDKTYLFNVDKPLNNFSLQITELGVGYNCNLPPNVTATPIANLDKYIPNAIMLYSQNLTIGQSYNGTFKVQIEEGTTATTYEPYKEYIKILYLNSPLLEGDTIEQSGNNIIHNHRYGKVVLDGSNIVPTSEKTLSSVGNYRWRFFKSDVKNSVSTTGLGICDKYPIVSPTDTWSSIEGITQNNDGNKIVLYLDKYKDGSDASKQALINELSTSPITFVYELATPTQEIISPNDNLLLDSYTNGHLDVDNVVPIDKVVFRALSLPLKYLSPNTEYIIQFESDNIGKFHYQMNGAYGDVNVVKGTNKFNCTMQDTINWLNLDFDGIGFNASKIVVTPKVDNNFGYFKGMKSVGECEDNKIEILSQNKNLLKLYDTKKVLNWNGLTIKILNNNEILINGTTNTNYTWVELLYNFQIGTNPKTNKIIPLNKNFKYTLSANIISGTASDLSSISFAMQHKNIETAVSCNSSNNFSTTFGDSDGAYRLWVAIQKSVTFNNCIISLQLEEGETKTPYIINTQNKKEILLNEPLRGLPNGVRDKYVIIDGKWYIERNCSSVVFDGSEGWYFKTIEPSGKRSYTIDNSMINGVNDYRHQGVCDKMPFVYWNDSPWDANYNCISTINKKVVIYTDFVTVSEFNSWLQNNPITVTYQLQSPTYEPIDYNPFEVYTDTTHISNNSTIPCNMVIKNSGYNCILKPNTTYTVSSNNGLSTVTTKDSIGDSILRFYNKDTSKITKMNKVLVLEGDYVTGNPPIPSFFKGMESAFEQELVTDENDKNFGKYKVEVLANNENLFPNNVNILENKVWDSSNGSIVVVSGYNCIDKMIKVLPNIDYSLSCNGKHCQGNIWFYDENKKGISQVYTSPFTTPPNTRYISYHASSSSCQVGAKLMLNLTTIIKDYIPHEENNITFYINEPLRGVGNVKDKVYVKEDKVVVERNCSIMNPSTLTESFSVAGHTDNYARLCLADPATLKDVKQYSDCICNTIPPVNGGLATVNYEAISLHTYLNYMYINVYTGKCSTDTEYLKKGQDRVKILNPTVVYQLATPVYEEVECDLSKLALEGYNHGTLFYNSNIPVTTQFYDFKVNIKDMLIPNETYYITFIADRVKDITINLSGVQVNYKTSMGYNKVPVQLGDVVNTNFSMESRGVELSDLMISTSTSLIYVKDMNDVCVYDEASNKYSITITSTGGNESDKRVILLDYPLLRLNKDIYDRLYYNNKDSRYRIDKKVFKHKFTNDREYNKYAAETNDTYYSSFISLNETIKDYVVITNEKVKTVKVEDDKYYFKIKWSDLGVSEKTEANGNQGMKDFFNNNEVYLYYATDGFVEIVNGLTRQTLKVYQPETTMNFLGNTTTTVTIVIPKKNV